MSALIKRSETLPARIESFMQAHGLTISDLKCEFTRQQSKGRGTFNGGRPFRIEYDLMMCKFCGNLPDVLTVPYCPEKVKILEQRRIED